MGVRLCHTCAGTVVVKCYPGVCADVESASLDDYNIHVIGSVFKQWLRDLPNPLLTFELYEEFIRAMGRCSATDLFSVSTSTHTEADWLC